MTKPSSKTDCLPPLGRRYTVAGRNFWLHSAGEGGPAVVFLPGAGLVGLDYLNIHEQAARFTTSVIYDRAGTGWSDDITLPRSAADVADELRSLLSAAGVPPPYVLVGHSLGGAYARRYTQRYPDEVAGLVFLDPAHEGYASMPKQTPLEQIKMGLAALPALMNIQKFYRPMFERMFAAWPDAVRRPLVDYHVGAWRKSLLEAGNLQPEILDEIRTGGDLPDAPLIVLAAMGLDPFMAAFAPEPYLRDLNACKSAFYAAFAQTVRRGENRLLDDAGHSTLHTDRPDAVVVAIRELVGGGLDRLACWPAAPILSESLPCF
jgi:pimeloyl-ACP methyl ester carboxylesterase